MFGDMMGKLQEMKQKVEETKQRLDTITVIGESGNGRVKVTANGNKKVVNITLLDQVLKGDKEELEDLLLIAVNRALEQSEKVYEAEMQGATKGFLPNIPGM
ncbi:MAG: YbaB/EbfC family nucleoid-associated protein [Bacteroidetes bacterium]|nr:YbaB/EbfC family nucleoid-associated protein [Bacteroidota bacterium]HET6243631.1 YbaB/EbfC family nucleoid-associated protein [Bacteroidia bacterium]